MNESSKKQKIALMLILVAVISVSMIGTYAYFMTQAGRSEEQKLTVKTGNLALTFEDNDDGLTERMELGKSYSKELRIRNTGTEAVTTNMIWSGLVNTYLEESLSYTLEYKTSEDGDWQTIETAHANVPQSERVDDYNLAINLTIPANTTYYYKVTITFNNLPDINQESDKTAILNTKFKLGNKILENPSLDTVKKLGLKIKDVNPTFVNAATTDETADGLYSLEDDYGTSYYYRGAVENNYVKFGGFYWRIIRINGDGSIRMIYDGTQAWSNANGETKFTTSEENRFTHTSIPWNNTYENDNKYVGWMYGGSNGESSTSKEQAQTNETNSTAKEKTDEWYEKNLEVNITNKNYNITKYLGDEIFCNDRTLGLIESSITDLGFGNKKTNYTANDRFMSNSLGYEDSTPTFICSQENDMFTVEQQLINNKKTNGALNKKIGLITADEIVAAGSGVSYTVNRYYYLYKSSKHWAWSLTPRNFQANTYAGIFLISTSGELYNTNVSNNVGAIAPVINIAPKYAITLIGSGTMDSPFQIPGVE